MKNITSSAKNVQEEMNCAPPFQPGLLKVILIILLESLLLYFLELAPLPLPRTHTPVKGVTSPPLNKPRRRARKILVIFVWAQVIKT